MPQRLGGRTRGGKGAGDLAVRCAAVPVRMHGSAGIGWARQELEAINACARDGILEKSGLGDVMANLWLARAAHEFAAAAAASVTLLEAEKHSYLEFAGKALLPMCKRMIQEFISEKGMNGVWMDDNAMLAGLPHKGKPNPALALPLRLNALWYAALEATGMALRGLGPMGAAAGLAGKKDPSGDHFERLAGRFRRAFNKAYWCEGHERICPPGLRGETTHGDFPDAEQLLLMILPASPIPRTKQLGVLKQIAELAAGPLGVWVLAGDGTRSESLLHRAWLAQALAVDADGEPAREQAAAAARPLEVLRETARTTGLRALYRDGKPQGSAADPLVTAEVLGTLERFIGF